MSQKQYDVLGFGVAAVDDLLYVPEYPPANVKVAVTRSARHGGGLACTALAAAGCLGGRCAYGAKLGNDELSMFIKSALISQGVDVSAVAEDAEAQPFHSIIVVDSSGARTIFYDGARYRQMAADDAGEALIAAARVVFLDYLVDPPAVALAKKVRSLGVPILADVEGRSAACLSLLPLIDYLIVSEEFGRWIGKTDDLRGACGHLAKEPRVATVVTAGAEGCYLCTRESPNPRPIPAFKIEAVDTTGCGDTFHGAFALGVARGLSAEDAAVFASAAAALKASGQGGWSALPSAGEVLGFLTQRLDARDRSAKLMECVAGLARERI